MQPLQYLRYVLQDPVFHAQSAVPVAWAALTCLVAIWAATSRLHWFLRALGVWAAVAIIVPVEAHELVWLFSVSLPLIVAMLWGQKERERGHAIPEAAGRNPAPVARFRYGLVDLLLVTLLVGLWLVVWIQAVRQYRPTNWIGWLVSCFALASISVLAHACVVSQRRWSKFALLLCALPAIALAIWWAGDWLRMWGLVGVSGESRMFIADVTLLTLAGVELALIIAVATALGRAAAGRAHSLRWRLLGSAMLAVGLVAAAIPLGYIYSRLLVRAPRPPKFAVETNHYHRILAIAGQVVALNPQNLSMEELKLASPASKAPQRIEALFRELYPLLQNANAVEFDPVRDATLDYARGQLGRVQTFRALTRCLNADSERARDSNQIDDAADAALAVLRLGTMLRRGGTAIEAIIGIGLGGMGQAQLVQLRDEFSPSQSRVVIAALDRSLAECESAASIAARSEYFDQQCYDWQGHLEVLLDEWNPRITPGYVYFQREATRWTAVNQLLRADLAIRVYRSEHGQLPDDWPELVPNYLATVPQDPYSAKPLVYRRADDGGFVIYSVGFDGQDNGGKFVGRTEYHNALLRAVESRFDFDLETLVRP